MKLVVFIFILCFLSFGFVNTKCNCHLLNLYKTSNKGYTQNDNTKYNKDNIKGNWYLYNGWFPDKNLVFTNTNKQKDVFIFKKNGTIIFRPRQETFDCPVGEFTMKDGKWSLEGDYLTLELRGLKISDYWYWWKIKYKIKVLTKDILILEVIKIVKNKEIDPSLTWEELLK